MCALYCRRRILLLSAILAPPRFEIIGGLWFVLGEVCCCHAYLAGKGQSGVLFVSQIKKPASWEAGLVSG